MEGKKELQDKREKMRREPPHRRRRREHQQRSRSPSVCVIIKTQPGSHQLGSTRCETTVTMSKHGGDEAAGPGVAAEHHLANQLARCPLRFQSVRLLGCLGNVCLGVCGCRGGIYFPVQLFSLKCKQTSSSINGYELCKTRNRQQLKTNTELSRYFLYLHLSLH